MVVETRRQYGKKVIASKWNEIESAENVFIDILSRLSVRDIQSFKTVSKKWHRSISTKYFAKQQITHSRKMPSYITCPKMDKTMDLFLLRPGSFKLISLTSLNPPERGDNENLYMISSFNGLICCINHIYDKNVESKFEDLQIWICSPSTGETLLLSQGTPSFEFDPSVGVAYGSDISDYRVFRIFCVGKKVPKDDGIYECEVYLSSTGAWKNIGPVPCVPMQADLSPYNSSHVFVRQNVYWLVSLDNAILSVELEGTFEVIKLPKHTNYLKEEGIVSGALYLINLRGSLSMVVLHPKYMNIWVWKEDNKKSSWVHICEDNTPFSQVDLVFAITS